MGAGETLPDDAAPAASDVELPVVDPAAYELGEELARGGFGRLLRARDRRLDRVVAIKQLRASNAQLEARFRLEARITARLSHPAIVPVHEVGRWPSGEPFYAMKFIAGRSLRAVLDATPALADRLARLPALAVVIDAVGHAHEEGVLHRDLKPGNLMIDDRGDAFVVDWGLAKERGAADTAAIAVDPDEDAGAGGMTAMGTVLGTPPYLPPEQARGDVVDETADVYALGALLYELVAGVAPYAGTPAEMLAQIVERPPVSLVRVQPSAPAELVAIIERSMAREPAARYPDARALAADVRRYLAREPVSAMRYRAGARLAFMVRRHRALVLGAAAIAVAVLVTALWSARGPIARPWRPQIDELESFDENSNGASFSPDGRLLAFDSDRDATRRQAWVGPVDGPAHRLPTAGAASGVRFARDGTAVLAYTPPAGFTRIPLDGSPPTLVLPGAVYADDCGGGRYLTAEEDQPCLTCRWRLVIVDADGRRRERLVLAPLQRVTHLRCDRAGSRAVFVTDHRDQMHGAGDVYLIDLEAGEPRLLVPAGGAAPTPTFHPDGKSVVFASARGGATNLWELPLDGGSPVQLTFGGGPDTAPDVSVDGRALVFDVDVTSTPLFEVTAGAPPRRLTASTGSVPWFSVSGDGTRLAYQLERGERSDIIVRTLASGDERAVGRGSSPSFTVDGASVVWAQDDRLVQASVDGTGAVQTIAQLPGHVRGLIIGPQGEVHVRLFRGDAVEPWRVSPDGVAAREAPAPYELVVPAPAGGWSVAGRPDGVELVPPGGLVGAPTNQRVPPMWLAWDADGTSFLFARDDQLVRRTLATGADVVIGSLPPGLTWLAPHPDRSRVYRSETIGRVRRQVITNFGDRRRPRS